MEEQLADSRLLVSRELEVNGVTLFGAKVNVAVDVSVDGVVTVVVRPCNAGSATVSIERSPQGIAFRAGNFVCIDLEDEPPGDSEKCFAFGVSLVKAVMQGGMHEYALKLGDDVVEWHCSIPTPDGVYEMHYKQLTLQSKRHATKEEKHWQPYGR